MNPWQAEHLISNKEAKALIEQQFPALAPADLVQLREGWDNVAFYVNEKYIFRFLRREIAVPGVKTETKLLPQIQKKLPLKTPFPTFIGEPAKNFPWPFLGYEILPGETACRMNLTNKEREKNAKTLATFLKALHQIDIKTLPTQPPKDNIRRLNVEFRIPQIEERLQTIKKSKLIDDIKPFEKIINDSIHLNPNKNLKLVHGDLYARHLLIDGKRNLTGIIDWGDIHLNDPAIDLSIAHIFLPPKAHDAFRKHYGAIDENTWLLARFRALHLLVTTVVYGHDIHDDALVREGLIGLGFFNSV